MNRLSRRIAIGLAVALSAGAAALVVTSASASGQVTAAFTKGPDWGTGYEGRYTITNGTDATITSWRVEFDIPAGSTLGTYWEASITLTGNHAVAVNRSYNGTLAAGASTAFGFNVNGSGTPTNCTVNGALPLVGVADALATGSPADPADVVGP